MNLRLDTAFGVSSMILKSAVSAIQEYLWYTQATSLKENQQMGCRFLKADFKDFSSLSYRLSRNMDLGDRQPTPVLRHLCCKAQKDPAAACGDNQSARVPLQTEYSPHF
jgi:hypothetical protein